MIDPSETLAAAIQDFGVDAMVDGGPENLRCLPPSLATDMFDGERVVHNGPTAVALKVDVASLGLVAGNKGSILTIDGNDHTVLAIDDDGLGGSILRLTEAS